MALITDILQLLGKAIASGVAVGIAAALLVLGLASSAQAANNAPRSMAPTLPPSEGGPSGVGALLADPSSPEQLLLGLLALAAAGVVAVIGRSTSAGGSP